MSANKTERLLNLVICLLSTRQFLLKDQIRAAVPQYAECPNDEAFDRMFERDKEELRDMGVPLETGGNDAWFDDEIGYRVDRTAYALPEVSFSPDELAVLGLASRVWQQASLAAPASRAVLKLKAAGVEPDQGSLVGIEPRVRTSEPAFEPVYAAVRDRRPIRFPYRTPGRPDVTERDLEPWGIVSRHGRWYVVGHDRLRGATRVFRLSRIAGPVRSAGQPGEVVVPEGIDLRAQVADPGPGPGDGRGPAVHAAGVGAAVPPPGSRRATRPGRPPGVRRGHGRVQRPGGAGRGGRGHGGRRPGPGPAGAARGRRSAACAACWARPPCTERSGEQAVTPGATERLSRLLALVPYLVSRQGIPLSEAAAEFDITEAQLVKDLELLFVCGTPGHLPDDLIDVDWDDGTVYLSNADPIARPLRLAVDEALALLVGLRALADVPGLHDREVLERTLLKLEAAAGEAAAPSTQVRVEVEAQRSAGRRPARAGRPAAGCI